MMWDWVRLKLEVASYGAAVIGGIAAFFIAIVKVVNWIATIRDEHMLLLKHLEENKDTAEDIATLKVEVAHSKLREANLLDEVRGLREDLSNFMTAMLKREG